MVSGEKLKEIKNDVRPRPLNKKIVIILYARILIINFKI